MEAVCKINMLKDMNLEDVLPEIKICELLKILQHCSGDGLELVVVDAQLLQPGVVLESRTIL